MTHLKAIICKPFPLVVLKVIVFHSVSDFSEATLFKFHVIDCRLANLYISLLCALYILAEILCIFNIMKSVCIYFM